jgi:hypothetical protein
MNNNNDQIVKLEHLKKSLKKDIEKIDDEINHIKYSRLTKEFLPLIPDDFKPLIKYVGYELTREEENYADVETFVILFTNDMAIYICVLLYMENVCGEHIYMDNIEVNGEFYYDRDDNSMHFFSLDPELAKNKLTIHYNSKKTHPKTYLKEILKAYKMKITKKNIEKIFGICQKLISFKSVILSKKIIKRNIIQ